MIVVAIVGVLAAIALPKFANLVLKSKEAAVQGSLGSLRSAVTLYYANNEGVYPQSAAFLDNALTGGTKYLRVIPGLTIPPPGNHAYTTAITGTVADNGQWFYTSIGGHVAVSCTHTDTKSSVWSVW
jgi:general secretion pathway protein G